MIKKHKSRAGWYPSLDQQHCYGGLPGTNRCVRGSDSRSDVISRTYCGQGRNSGRAASLIQTTLCLFYLWKHNSRTEWYPSMDLRHCDGGLSHT